MWVSIWRFPFFHRWTWLTRRSKPIRITAFWNHFFLLLAQIDQMYRGTYWIRGNERSFTLRVHCFTFDPTDSIVCNIVARENQNYKFHPIVSRIRWMASDSLSKMSCKRLQQIHYALDAQSNTEWHKRHKFMVLIVIRPGWWFVHRRPNIVS